MDSSLTPSLFPMVSLIAFYILTLNHEYDYKYLKVNNDNQCLCNFLFLISVFHIHGDGVGLSSQRYWFLWLCEKEFGCSNF